MRFIAAAHFFRVALRFLPDRMIPSSVLQKIRQSIRLLDRDLQRMPALGILGEFFAFWQIEIVTYIPKQGHHRSRESRQLVAAAATISA